MIYTVKLISSDRNMFEFSCKADSKIEAINKAKSKIEELGWENYNYKFFEINIKKG